MVCIHSSHRNTGVSGFCGNFDDNVENDLVTRQGKRVTDDWRGYNEIGDSWWIQDPENPE